MPRILRTPGIAVISDVTELTGIIKKPTFYPSGKVPAQFNRGQWVG